MNCANCGAENEAPAKACLACGEALGPAAAAFGSGSLFDSRYEILAPLGRGGMGMVYKAHDRNLDETVALKVLRPDLAHKSDLIAQRFRSEIKLARKIRHKNVCSIYGDGEYRALLYICMELVEGTDLKRLIREKGRLPPAEAYEIAIQVAEGLQAIHEVGIIHRDLKTANIMRDARGHVRLMDFGLAKEWQTGDASGATAAGHVVGTPDYMSPEQARGQKLGVETDIYALGIVVFELFTGEVPFRGDSPLTTLMKHLHDPPPFDAPVGGHVPGALVPVLRQALAKDPRERYHSAREMAEALRRARDSTVDETGATPMFLPPVTTAAATVPPSTNEPMAPGASRGRGWKIALGIAGAVLIAVTIADALRPKAKPVAPSSAPESVPRPVENAVTPQAAPMPTGVIQHEPIGCVVAGRFPLIDAKVDPKARVARARVYFKSALGPAYYYVEMKLANGKFVGKLPRPKMEASPITYYIQIRTQQITTLDWSTSQTPEVSAVVMNDASNCPSGARVADVGPPGAVTVFSASTGAVEIKGALGLEELLQTLKDADPGVRAGAAQALAAMAPVARSAIDASIQRLKQPDPVDRQNAADELHETGQLLVEQAMVQLIATLNDGDAGVRRKVTEAIGAIGPPVALAVVALKHALKDKVPAVRKAAAAALGTMGPVVASAMAALDVTSSDKDRSVADAAQKALRSIRAAAE